MASAELSSRHGADGLYPGGGGRLAGVERIAVLRANAVGDLVVALPALAALRRAYPGARISLLGRAWHAAFLRGRRSPVDEVIVVPAGITLGPQPAASHAEAAEAETFIAAMRERRFNLALQLHGGGRHSNPFVRRLGARCSAGLCAADAEPLDRNLPYRVPHPEVLRLLEAVALVGAHGCDVEPRLEVTSADRKEAEQAIAATATGPGGDDRPLLVLQPGCTDSRRAWPADRFAAVADHFVRHGARVALNGTTAEAATLAAVRCAMHFPALDLTGVLSLGGLLGLLERSRLLVGNDTGTTHLARAIGVPGVTICWIGNLAGYGPMRSADHAVALSWRLECPRCGRRNVVERCTHDDSFMDEVCADEVIGLAEELWRGGHRRTPRVNAG